MMFDPPDFPYKELADTLRDELSSDILLYNSGANSIDTLQQEKNPIKVTETIISTIDNQLSLSIPTDRFFNQENNISLLDFDTSKSHSELCIVQSESFPSYEPILLDDHTVNQFLLPIKVPSANKSTADNNGPDLLALNSCVICHEIFTTDADLLDHTISAHASDNAFESDSSTLTSLTTAKPVTDENNSDFNLECDWLVCSVCERVLSTAIESEPRAEPLCCTNGSGNSMTSRKLSTMFVCDFCNYLFANGEALDRHKLSCCIQEAERSYSEQRESSILDHNIEDFGTFSFCNVCGKQFLNDEDLKTHNAGCQRPVMRQRRPYSTSNSNKMWNCASCNQLFATARELYRHKRGEDRPPGTPLMAYVCEECDKVLGSMCALHTHKKMHKVSKPGYPCRVCGRRFNQSGHLAIHMRMHTGERPYPCDLCSKAFKVKVERDDHRRTHTGERPFACAVCPKTFTAAARLREHARIHTDQRPYKCDICGAAFRRPYARTVHTLIHTGEKPHECDVCGTAFRRSGDMWKHKRTIHSILANCDGN